MSRAFEGFGEDYRFANIKVIALEDFGPRIRIRQEVKYGVGGQLWDAAYVLSKFVCSRFPSLRGQRIIELGCGCALPSIVSCLLGGTVVATDLCPPLDLAAQNFTLNAEVLTGGFETRKLDWTCAEDREALRGGFDLVLMSDLFYMPVNAS